MTLFDFLNENFWGLWWLVAIGMFFGTIAITERRKK